MELKNCMLKSKKVPFYKVYEYSLKFWIGLAFDSDLLPQDFRNGHAYIFALPNSQQSRAFLPTHKKRRLGSDI